MKDKLYVLAIPPKQKGGVFSFDSEIIRKQIIEILDSLDIRYATAVWTKDKKKGLAKAKPSLRK